MYAREIVVKSFETVSLLGCLPHSVFVKVLQLLYLSPVILSLQLQHLNLLIEVCCLQSQLSIAVSFLGVVLVQSEGLEVSVIE